MTIEEVAERLNFATSKVSRIETNNVRVTTSDLHALLDLYEVNGEDREALVNLAKEAKRKGWWHSYTDVMPNWFHDFMEFESEASSIRTYETQLVPGLLQTEHYTRELIRAKRPSAGPHELERRVATRLARQKLLTKDDPLKLWAVLDETVLRRPVGTYGMMADQLYHLAEQSELPNVELQVLPFEAGPHTGMDGAFVIFGFPEAADTDVVYLQNLTSGLYLEKLADVDRYMLVFDHLMASALSTENSLKLIRRVAKEFSLASQREEEP